MKPNPITGLLGVQGREDIDDTAQVEVLESIPGEVDFDRVVKAQASAPHVRERINNLELCLWSLAEQLILHEPHSPLVERAKILLRNKLELDENPKPYIEPEPPEMPEAVIEQPEGVIR